MLRLGLALLLLGWTAGAWAADTGPQLSWTDTANDETGFEIERAPYGGTFAQVGTVGANVTTWRDTTAAAGVRYCWRVRAVNESGASSYTGAVCLRSLIPSDSSVHP